VLDVQECPAIANTEPLYAIFYMRYVIVILIFLFACRSSDKNLLSNKIETIEVVHLPWACDSSKFLLPTSFNLTSYNEFDCARWVTPEDISRYEDKANDSLRHLSFFLEPADSSLTIPDTIEFNNDAIRVTGQFYLKKGFPKGHKPLHTPDSARVFRYSKFIILKHKYGNPLVD